MALETELSTFTKMLSQLMASEGKYAVISGDRLLGVFESHSDALNAGYKEFGMEPFLVKLISSIEPVANFSRALRLPCTAQL